MKKLLVGVLLGAMLLSSCENPQNILFKPDAKTGALHGLYLANDTAMNWIMRADSSQYSWVDYKYGWGLGNLTANGTAYAWTTPTSIYIGDSKMTAKYPIGDIEVQVSRQWNRAGNLEESYRFVNTGKENIDLQDIAINTPFNDNYPDAKTCYEARCNAHIWTGANDAYVFCTRMSGAKGGLGLIMQKGALTGYEINERSSKTGSSNFRGVIRLNPAKKTLKADESYEVRWLLLPAEDWDDFQVKAIDNGLIIASANRYLLETGEEVTITFKSKSASLKGKILLNGKEVADVSGKEMQYCTTVKEPGEHTFTLQYEDGKTTSVECLVVSSIDNLIDKRSHFIANHQQFFRPGDARNGALIVYDNDIDSLYINGESGRKRSDCDEGRERVCMGILLARQYQRTSDEKLLTALNKYATFVRSLQKPDYTTNSTVDFSGKNRGYNYPWVADFWFTMFETTGDKQYLKDGYGTLRALVRYFNYGFYCIGMPTRGYTLLKENGFTAEAETLLNDFKQMADVFCANGPFYPSSEVNYEQSIVGPSVIHQLNVYLLTGDEKYLQGAEQQLPLLESFGGRQPSYHLNDIAIRHWDGYWFGKDQVWGDTFPHYWSTISGIAYRLYAKATGKQEYAERALDIFRNNFCLFTEDGRGSCAFIYPDKVDGRKAHFYDPFANDQDWAMVHWLEYGPGFQ